jgi:peptidoglycan-N-acetylmuramic acid deacetylase
MIMKKKYFWGIILAVFVFVGLLVWWGPKKKENAQFLQIELFGSRIINIDEPFEEPGYRVIDSIDGDITDAVEVKENIDYRVSGTYEIQYSVKNSRGEKAVASRFVILDQAVNHVYKKEYDKISNQSRSWWSANKKNQTRPSGGFDINKLKQYHATFLGPDEKLIYLTFDEGSNDTYVNEIVDVLNQNDVKATFFLCQGFVVKNPELMKKLVASGHSVGNHTAHHVVMSELATEDKFEDFLKELTDLEDAFYQTTGAYMDKIYREPKGEWSERSLAILKDLGYKTFFYSADYLDWNGEVSKEYAYNELMKRYHNGAIYLIHPQNKGNYLALDSFIKELKSRGYSFGLVRDIEMN